MGDYRNFILSYSLVFGCAWIMSITITLSFPQLIPKIIPSSILAIWFGGIAVVSLIEHFQERYSIDGVGLEKKNDG